MVVYETTRAKTAFDAFASTSISSMQFNAVTDGIGYVQNASATFQENYTAGGNQTYQARSEGGGGGLTAGTGFSNSNGYGGTSWTSVNASGSTWSQLRTGQSANSSTNSFGTTSNSGSISFATTSEIMLVTSATTTYEAYLVTSSTFTATDIPFAETSTRTFTSTGTAHVVFDTEWEFTYDEVFTTTAVSSATVTSYTNVTVNGPYEIGTVVEGNDVRLYSFSGSQSFGFPNASFTKATFWADVTENSIEFITYTQVPSVSYANPAETYSGNAASLSQISMVVTSVTGWNIPHGTSTGIAYSAVPTNFTSSGGIGSNSGTANVTYSTSYTAGRNTTTAVTVVAVAGLDSSTYTLATASTVETTYSRTSSVSPSDPFRSHFVGSSTYYTVVNGTGSASNIHNTSASGFVVNKVGTKTMNIATNMTSTAGNAEVFQPVPKRGGRKSPRSMKQSDGTGTNLSFPSSIFYPWYSSLQSNVLVAVKRDGTAVTGSTTWRYKWDSFTLKFTTKNSATSGTGSGQIGTAGAMSSHAWQMKYNFPAIGGGFCPVSAASAIILLKPGGHGITSYNSAGNTTTAKSVLTAYSTVQLAQTAEVISGLPVVSVSTGWGGGGAPFVTYTRN